MNDQLKLNIASLCRQLAGLPGVSFVNTDVTELACTSAKAFSVTAQVAPNGRVTAAMEDQPALPPVERHECTLEVKHKSNRMPASTLRHISDGLQPQGHAQPRLETTRGGFTFACASLDQLQAFLAGAIRAFDENAPEDELPK